MRPVLFSMLDLKQMVFTTAVIMLLALLYWYGATQHGRIVNTNMQANDQSAYMGYAQRLAEANDTYAVDGARMPVYPFLQSLFYEPGMADEAFFTRGKIVNVALSLIILGVVFLIFRHHFPLLHAINVTLVTAFTVFIFKAAYFQAELLYYFFSFVAFVLTWQLLVRPRWQWGVGAGIALGLAYMTKASVLPGLVLFLGFAAVKLYRLAAAQRSTGQKLPFNVHWLGLPLVLLAFLATVAPYISNSKQVFGHYFYNVNSTFYMWYDSWDEVAAGTRAHGDRQGWPDMPPELLPGPGKYLREHTPGQIAQRLLDGLAVLLVITVTSYGYFKYLLVYLLFPAVALVSNWPVHVQAARRYRLPLLFAGCYFSLYVLLYTWFTPIAAGNRFTLALFLPFLYVISWVIAKQYHLYPAVAIGRVRLNMLNLVVLVVLVVDVYLILTSRIVTVYGGS